MKSGSTSISNSAPITAKNEWHQVSCSGGKDSTALVLGMWERGMQIDEIVTAEIGMEWDEVNTVFKQIEEITGLPVTRVKAPESRSFEHLMFEKVITRGKRAGTCGYGWPTSANRWCTTLCKARPLDAHLKAKEKDGYRVISYIGIAADEKHRSEKNVGVVRIEKRYPLIDWGMTEADCLRYCYEYGIDFGGLYNHYTRISCWCCPLMRINDARTLYHYYPEKWQQLKDMDARARNQFKAAYSVEDLERRFIAEDAQGRLEL